MINGTSEALAGVPRAQERAEAQVQDHKHLSDEK